MSAFFSFFASLLAALLADAVNDEPVTGHSKSFVAGNLISQANEVIALEFNQLPTSRAIQVIVLRVAVVVFIDRAAIKLKTIQQPRINKFSQRSIDRCIAYIVVFAATWQSLDRINLDSLL